MASPPVRGSLGGFSNTASASITATYPAGIQAGDVAYQVTMQNGTTGALTTLATGWAIASGPNDNGTTHRSYLLVKVCDGTETGTFTHTLSAGQQTASAGAVITSADDALDVFATPSLQLTVTQVDAPTVTPAANDCIDLVLSGMRYASSATVGAVTPNAAFTEDAEFIQSTTGTAVRYGAWVGHRNLTGQSGTAQGVFTAAATYNVTGQNWVYRVVIPSRAVTGSAALSGTGTLAAGSTAFAASVALSGTGTLTTGPTTPAISAVPVALSGSGTLTVAALGPGPVIVGFASGTSGSGTFIDPKVTLPTGIADGDIGYFFVSSSAGSGTMTDPSGWALNPIGMVNSAALIATRLWQKTLTAAESGTTVTATAAAAKWTAWVLVLRGASTSTVSVSSTVTTVDATPLTVPAVTPAVNDSLLVQASAIRLAAATTPSHTPAAGWDEKVDVVGGVSPVNSAVLATQQLTGQAGVTQGPWTATIASGRYVSFSFAAAPVSTGFAAAVNFTGSGTLTAKGVQDSVTTIGDSLYDRQQSDDSPNSYGGPYSVDPVKDAFVLSGWNSGKVYTSGKASRKIADSSVGLPITQVVIDNYRSNGIDSSTYVIALGTNNRTDTQAGMKAEIDKVLDKIAEGPGPYKVYWIGTAYPSFNTTDQASVGLLKAAVLQCQAERAGSKISVFYCDWNNATLGWGAARDSKWLADGVHFDDTTDGYAERNAFIAAAATMAFGQSVALSGSGTLSVAGAPLVSGAVGIAATSNLTAAGTVTRLASATLGATSNLTAAGTVGRPGVVTLGATSNLTATATPTVVAAATLGAHSTLSAAASVTVVGFSAAVIAASSNLVAAGVVTATAAATLGATSTLTVSATISRPGVVTLSATSTLTVSGMVVKQATATLGAVSTLTAAVVLTRVAAVVLSASSDLVAVGVVSAAGTVHLSAVSRLTATGLVTTPSADVGKGWGRLIGPR